MAVDRHPQLDLRLDRQLCFALYAASRAFTRAYGPVLAEHGLTYPQYLVMMVLWERDGSSCSVGEIGTVTGMDSGTLTPLVKRLERDGLVERRRDVVDERRVLVTLTEEGRVLRDRMSEVPRTLAGRLGLSPAEGAALKAQLERLTAMFEPVAD